MNIEVNIYYADGNNLTSGANGSWITKFVYTVERL